MAYLENPLLFFYQFPVSKGKSDEGAIVTCPLFFSLNDEQ
jgi:hypothetical protein